MIRRGRPLPFDVQRDATGYHVFVAFRNAVEAMRIRRRLGLPPGTPVEPDDDQWWGFGDLRGPRGGQPDDGDEGGGLTGSGVPRRPPDGAGWASAEAEPAPAFEEVDATR